VSEHFLLGTLQPVPIVPFPQFLSRRHNPEELVHSAELYPGGHNFSKKIKLGFELAENILKFQTAGLLLRFNLKS